MRFRAAFGKRFGMDPDTYAAHAYDGTFESFRLMQEPSIYVLIQPMGRFNAKKLAQAAALGPLKVLEQPLIALHNDPVNLTGTWAIYGRDPFGNIIELMQPVAD